MPKWILDNHNIAMEEGSGSSYHDYADSYWRTGIYSIAYNRKDVIEKASTHLLNTPVDKWQRHPDCSESGEWGNFSRDQLILVLAALKFHKLNDHLNKYTEMLPLYSKLGGKWYVTVWFKLWLNKLSNKHSLLDTWLPLACFINCMLYSGTKKNGFNVHLWAWMIYSLDNGLIKHLCWLAFNMGGYNIPKWSGVKENHLYLYMQGEKKPFALPPLYDCYLWQENDIKPAYWPPVEANTPINVDILTHL